MTREFICQVDYFCSDRHNCSDMREEIIRCRDCKFFDEKGIYHDWWCNRLGLKPNKDSYCSWADKVD